MTRVAYLVPAALSLGCALSLLLRAALVPTVALICVGALVRPQLALPLLLVAGGWWWGTERVRALDRSVLAAHVGTAERALVETQEPVHVTRYAVRVTVVVRRWGMLHLHERALLELSLGAGSVGGKAADARRVDRAAFGGAGDSSFATAPNLVVIDGGKGQLSAALAAMQAYDLPRVAVISLAKRIEEVFVPGRSDPIVLSRHNPGLQLLQQIRDEAHRFALGFHRQRRESRGFASLFDELQGVGPARRRALLHHFGSVEEMAAASQEELEGVPGVPAAVARRIYAQLHKTGRG